MRALVCSFVLVLTAVGFSEVQAQTAKPPATTKPAGDQGQKPLPSLSQPLATVNDEPITRGEVINLLNNYQIPPGSEEQVYRDAVETLVNTHLVNQFLERQKIAVSEDKVTEEIAGIDKKFKAEKTDLATELLRTNTTMADLRKELTARMRWIAYLNAKATDAELKRFVSTHKDLFSGTKVKVSHILVMTDPKASEADKEKSRQKLEGIKKDIEGQKMTFAEAANKFSEDPANVDGHGGDVGYFGLSDGFIEEFANAAFAAKKGVVTDVFETPYGYHILLVTDRKEGTPLDFEQNKVYVKQMYGAEIQKNLLTAERKTAKIVNKPMPTDLFAPSVPPTSVPPLPAATEKAKAAAPK